MSPGTHFRGLSSNYELQCVCHGATTVHPSYPLPGSKVTEGETVGKGEKFYFVLGVLREALHDNSSSKSAVVRLLLCSCCLSV